jgi:hypothetical protein
MKLKFGRILIKKYSIMESFVEYNWSVIRHVYKGHVDLVNGELKNIKLHPSHFAALKEVIQYKKFCPNNRFRVEDSLRDAIGNWLYTEKFGSWRNPNKARPYKDDNKNIWQKFCKESQDYSMKRAVIGNTGIF